MEETTQLNANKIGECEVLKLFAEIDYEGFRSIEDDDSNERIGP